MCIYMRLGGLGGREGSWVRTVAMLVRYVANDGYEGPRCESKSGGKAASYGGSRGEALASHNGSEMTSNASEKHVCMLRWIRPRKGIDDCDDEGYSSKRYRGLQKHVAAFYRSKSPCRAASSF